MKGLFAWLLVLLVAGCGSMKKIDGNTINYQTGVKYIVSSDLAYIGGFQQYGYKFDVFATKIGGSATSLEVISLMTSNAPSGFSYKNNSYNREIQNIKCENAYTSAIVELLTKHERTVPEPFACSMHDIVIRTYSKSMIYHILFTSTVPKGIDKDEYMASKYNAAISKQ